MNSFYVKNGMAMSSWYWDACSAIETETQIKQSRMKPTKESIRDRHKRQRQARKAQRRHAA